MFLTQRSKALATSLSSLHGANGHTISAAQERGEKASQPRKTIVKDTKQKIEAALDIMTKTLGTARIMFREDELGGKHSLMSETLQSMQMNSPSNTLPSELQLTTNVLLTTLPSSPHTNLLPVSISSYAPYVDGASPVPQAELRQRLQQWFNRALEDCRITMTRWMSGLQTVREVWDVRTFISDLVNRTEGLDAEEKRHVKSVVDDICQQQIMIAWKSVVAEAHRNIREQLASAISTLRTASADMLGEQHPIEDHK